MRDQEESARDAVVARLSVHYDAPGFYIVLTGPPEKRNVRPLRETNVTQMSDLPVVFLSVIRIAVAIGFVPQVNLFHRSLTTRIPPGVGGIPGVIRFVVRLRRTRNDSKPHFKNIIFLILVNVLLPSVGLASMR